MLFRFWKVWTISVSLRLTNRLGTAQSAGIVLLISLQNLSPETASSAHLCTFSRHRVPDLQICIQRAHAAPANSSWDPTCWYCSLASRNVPVSVVEASHWSSLLVLADADITSLPLLLSWASCHIHYVCLPSNVHDLALMTHWKSFKSLLPTLTSCPGQPAVSYVSSIFCACWYGTGTYSKPVSSKFILALLPCPTHW